MMSEDYMRIQLDALQVQIDSLKNKVEQLRISNAAQHRQMNSQIEEGDNDV